MSACRRSITRARFDTEVARHDANARALLSTAASISSFVHCGTSPMSSFVAGSCKSIHRSVLD